MSLINTIRAIEDPRFVWRIKGALLTRAVTLIDDPDAEVQGFARSIVRNPLGDASFAVALVAANPAISGLVNVDAFNTVNSEAVPDSDIEYVIASNWDALQEEFYGPTPAAQ